MITFTTQHIAVVGIDCGSLWWSSRHIECGKYSNEGNMVVDYRSTGSYSQSIMPTHTLLVVLLNARSSTNWPCVLLEPFNVSQMLFSLVGEISANFYFVYKLY